MTDDEICGVSTINDTPCENPAGDNGFCWIPSHNPGDDNENPGRPTKLTKEREENIASMIEEGHSLTAAARSNGIHKETLLNWMQRGEEQDEGIYADFFDRLTRARGEGESRYVAALIEIAKQNDDTATLMSMLKQRYPESWGEVDRGEQTTGVVVKTEAGETTEIDPETLEVTNE